MNLLEVLEKKRAYESLIAEAFDDLALHLHDSEALTEVLNTIEGYIDKAYHFERLINNKYHSTIVSEDQTVSDIISYADGLTRKIEVLRHLLLQSYKMEAETGQKSDVDSKALIASIQRYETLKNTLVSKVKEVCLQTEV